MLLKKMLLLHFDYFFDMAGSMLQGRYSLRHRLPFWFLEKHAPFPLWFRQVSSPFRGVIALTSVSLCDLARTVHCFQRYIPSPHKDRMSP